MSSHFKTLQNNNTEKNQESQNTTSIQKNHSEATDNQKDGENDGVDESNLN